MVSFVCFRSANQVVSLEQMFTRDGATSHCKATSPNCHLVDSRVNWLQRLRESSYGDDDKGLLVKFLLKTRSLRATEVSHKFYLCAICCVTLLLFFFSFSNLWLFFLPADKDSNRFKREHHLFINRSNKIWVRWPASQTQQPHEHGTVSNCGLHAREWPMLSWNPLAAKLLACRTWIWTSWIFYLLLVQ